MNSLCLGPFWKERIDFLSNRILSFFDAWKKAGSEHLFLSSVCLFCISFLLFLSYGYLEKFSFSRDAFSYLELAQEAQANYYLDYSPDRTTPPLLIMLMIHGKHWLDLPEKVTGLSIALFCGSLCISVIFLVTWILSHDYFLSLLSALLFLLTPGIRNISIDILRDAPSLCMCLLSFLFIFLYCKKNKRILFFSAGVFLAFSLGFRHENLEFILLVSLIDLFVIFTKRANKRYVAQKKIDLFLYYFGAVFGYCTVILVCFNSNCFSLSRLLLLYRYFSA